MNVFCKSLRYKYLKNKKVRFINFVSYIIMEEVNFDNYKKVLQEIMLQIIYPKPKMRGKVCEICLSKYSEKNYSHHIKTERHLNFVKLNDKLRKLVKN